MNDTFQIEVTPAGIRTVIVRVRGLLDARSAPSMLAQCRNVADQRRNLVLNLAGVTFVSSSGIGAMLALVEEFRHTANSVRLAEVSSAVGSAISVLNLDQFLCIDATERAALEAAEAA